MNNIQSLNSIGTQQAANSSFSSSISSPTFGKPIENGNIAYAEPLPQPFLGGMVQIVERLLGIVSSLLEKLLGNKNQTNSPQYQTDQVKPEQYPGTVEAYAKEETQDSSSNPLGQIFDLGKGLLGKVGGVFTSLGDIWKGGKEIFGKVKDFASSFSLNSLFGSSGLISKGASLLGKIFS